ncbi:MAG: hypothetical protein GY832_13165 [Chloroflexi bacterium]|nr:hypothetical protein [Chloroflexota bacterium]
MIILSLTVSALWIATLAQDLARREVSLLVFIALAVASLAGHPWPWWALTGLALLWPSRERALLLVPCAMSLGALTGEYAPAIAMMAGITAWALSWWGGADGIALLVLALRGGLPGLVIGAVVSALWGIILMMVRKRSLLGLFGTVSGILALRAEDEDIPAETEMPAAAALAVGGLIVEFLILCSVVIKGGKSSCLFG